MQPADELTPGRGGGDRKTWRGVLSQSWTSTNLVYVIFRKVLLAYAVLVALGAALFLAWENGQARTVIASRHAELHRSFENVISEALWTFSETVLRSAVLGLTQDGTVTGARIGFAETGATFTSGVISGSEPGWAGSLNGQYVSRWPLSWTGPRGPEVVGFLELETSEQVIRNRLLEPMLMILLFSLLALFSLFIVFILAIRADVLSPISTLSQMMHDFRPGDRDAAADAPRRPTGEIGKLYDSFRDLEDRLQSAHGRLTASAEEMARQLAKQAEELSRAHALNMSLEVHRAQEAERSRLMREIHDGFGSELVSARIAAERGNLDAAELALFLSKCMADLHLVINVTGTTAGNLAEALADWRYRVSRQLGAEPFKLVWDVNLGDAPVLLQRAVLQILRIAQEALSNAARHSRASRIQVSAQHAAGVITLRVADNGRGFCPASIAAEGNRGKGLASMRARAREIGAVLDVSADSFGCRVTLVYQPDAAEGAVEDAKLALA